VQPTVLLDYQLAVERDGYVVRALLKLEGRAPATGDRLPLNLSLVLDRSGSMAGEKLERAREAAAFLVRRLSPEDIVSVVAYDDHVMTVANPARGSQQGNVPRAIEAIVSGNSTNLSGGWLKGREHVSAGRKLNSESRLNRVILLTDGLANVGITEPDNLVGLPLEAKRAGITTTTIGFGEDYDEVLLRQMADAGGGNTYYIETPDQAPGVFEEEIEGLLSLSAQNITVTVRPTTAVELVHVHNDYPNESTDRGIRVEVGDLYAREPKLLLLDFFAPGAEVGGERGLAEIVISADVLTEGGGVEHQEVKLPIATSLDGEGARNPEIERESLLLDAAKAREEALRQARAGDYDGARALLCDMSMRLEDASPEYGAVVAEHAEDLSQLSTLMDREKLRAMDVKYASQRAYNVRRGKAKYEEKLRRRKD
jgi:Ca-activated chloride channel family protein